MRTSKMSSLVARRIILLYKWGHLTLTIIVKTVYTFWDCDISLVFRCLDVVSPWIQTQHTHVSFCLKTTERWHLWKSLNHIPIIQKDSMGVLGFCVEIVCLDAVTGRLNGLTMLLYQWHIKESGRKDEVVRVNLDTICTLGVWYVITTNSLSGTILFRLTYVSLHSPVGE